LKTENWSTHEWIYFIRELPQDIGISKIKLLENNFGLSHRNYEIQCVWLEYAINNNYGPALLPQIKNFLTGTGRRKFLMPVYEAMINHGMINEAKEIFDSAKAGYHPIALQSVSQLLNEINNTK
jgi:hypothetical protein